MPELNYSVSQYQATETVGDNFETGAGTGTGQLTAQTVQLVITPDVGFTVSAIDFSIGGVQYNYALPNTSTSPGGDWVYVYNTNANLSSEVNEVRFGDSIGPGETGNTIKVDVYLVDGFVMPSNNITINIDIDGEAKPILSTQVGTVVSYNLLDAGYVGDTVANSTRIPTNSGDAAVNQTGVISGYTFSAGDENIQNIILESTYGVNGSSQTTYSNNVGVFPESAAEQPSIGFLGSYFQIKSNTISLGQPADTITSINQGTIAPSVFWTIKPLPGYVVSASDFAQVTMGYISSVSSNQPYITPSAIAQPEGINSNQFGANNSFFNPLFNGDFPSSNPAQWSGYGVQPYIFYSQNNQLQNPDSLDDITQWNQGGGNAAFVQIPLVFSNTSTPYSADNRVVVTYTNQDDFIVDGSFESLSALMAFAGRATPIIQGQGGMPAIDINSYIDIVNPSSNGGTVTVTGSTNTGIYGTSNTTSVTSIIEKGGFTNEATVYSISGTVPESKSTVIATIRIDADTNKYFLNAPSLTRDSVLRANKINTNGIIKMSVKSVEKTNNKVTAYILNVKYKNNVATSIIDGLKVNLNYKQQSIVTLSSIINHVKYGSDCLNRIGERRKITLTGSVGVPFILTLQQVLRSEKVTGFKSGVEIKFQSRDPYGKSILSRTVLNHNLIGSGGKSIGAISSVTGKNGKYSFDQRFPSLPVTLKTLVNGAITVASKTLVLDKTEGVETGDQLFYATMPAVTSLKVASVTNSTTLVLNQAIIIADNLAVEFKRSTSYDITVTPETSFSSAIPTTIPTYTINQYTDPTVTIRISATSHLYKINAQDLPGHASIRQEYDTVYSGKAKKDGIKLLKSHNIKNKFKLTYLLDSETTKTFTAARTPFFSASIPYDGLGTVADNTSRGSDWSNTINKDLYSSNIKIYNTAITSTGAETITITAELEIINWGVEDIVFELDLDKIVTIS